MILLDPGVALYVAAAVALIVWLALFFYLWTLDRRTRELRRKLDERAQPASRPAAPQVRPIRNQHAEPADGAQE